MAKLKRTAFMNAGDRIRALPQDRRERIEVLAGEMASELHLAESHKALSITHRDLAERTGRDQDLGPNRNPPEECHY